LHILLVLVKLLDSILSKNIDDYQDLVAKAIHIIRNSYGSQCRGVQILRLWWQHYGNKAPALFLVLNDLFIVLHIGMYRNGLSVVQSRFCLHSQAED